MIKVVKFGGSSLASAAQFKKVGAIIRKEETRRYVVPSAPGKRHSGDTKVTDLLYKCYGQAILDDDREEDFEEILKVIKDRYDSIINGLELTISLDDEFKTIRENFSKKIGRDYAASRGEYLNGRIMAEYLGYEFIDAAEVICFDKEGNFDGAKTQKILSKRLASTERAVIPVSTELCRTGRSRLFPGADRISPGPLWPAPSTQTFMRTGLTCPDSWWQIPGSLRIQRRSM